MILWIQNRDNRESRCCEIKKKTSCICNLLFRLFFLSIVPVLRRLVPESSYTTTCLPFQTVTECCRYDKRKLCWRDMNWNFCSATRAILCGGFHLYTYLRNTHPSNVYVRLQRKVQTCMELSDVELCWGKLHRCHLLAEVGWHHMLTQDQHCIWIVCCQEIQAGAPLKEGLHWNF